MLSPFVLWIHTTKISILMENIDLKMHFTKKKWIYYISKVCGLIRRFGNFVTTYSLAHDCQHEWFGLFYKGKCENWHLVWKAHAAEYGSTETVMGGGGGGGRVSKRLPFHKEHTFQVLNWCAKSLQSCPTLCDPMDWRLPCSSVHGILQARILEWIAVPSSRPRDQIRVSYISCIGRQVL